METISQYLNMGGHGGFIWPAYIIVFVVMVALMIVSRRSLKNAQEELETLTRGADGRSPDRETTREAEQ
ncbi:MAG: heme exporter protein CcmD [Proteobacteria bacterium]|nr:heme exporter protein CcmD [Pseudomonadota bacterium]MDA1022298.1 heme exporter protein CcmD [Pseudomonadota bacterium]